VCAQYKVKGTLSGVTKSVEVDRAASFAEVKSKLESKFGCQLALSYKRSDGTFLSISVSCR
jgi:hypothetical protein